MYGIIFSWLLGLMTAFAPPSRAATLPAFPGYEETIEEREERYAGIAAAVLEVAYDPNRVPVYKGPAGRARTAALLLAVAYHESGFARDVDLGPCYRGPDGKSDRCDHGHAACMLQIHVGPDGKTREGWTPEELFADRHNCFASGMESLRRAAQTCRKYGEQFTFASYAAGTCDKRGLRGSQELLALQDRFYKRFPVPKEARSGQGLPDPASERDAQRLLDPSARSSSEALRGRAAGDEAAPLALHEERPSGS